MSNDPNQSNRGAPNKLGHGPSWLERQGQTFAKQTAQERLDRQRIGLANERVGYYQAAIDEGIPPEFTDRLEAGISAEMKVMNTLGPRLQLRSETRRERFSALAASHISREFSPSSVNGQVADIARSTYGMNRAMGHMNSSYSQLESTHQSHMNQIGNLERESLDIAQDLYDVNGHQDPGVANRLKGRQIVKQMLEKEMGGISGAMAMQRSLGMDPLSQNRSLFSTGQKANEALSTGALGGDAKKAAEDLAAALENLKNTVGKTDEQIEQFRSDAKKAADEFEKAAAGGGGRNYANYAQVAGGLLGVGGEMASNILLGQTNTITGNRAGAAALTNNIYDRRRAALAGDMSQLTMLTSGVFAGAQAEGSVNKKSSLVSDGMMSGGMLLGGGATLMAAGAASSATGIGAVVGVPMMAIGGVAAIAGGATKAVNMYRGADANAEKLAEEQRQINLAAQLAHVPGAMRQRLYDYGMGVRTASLEAGGTGDAFLQKTNDSFFLHRLESARIGTDQFTQMAQQGFAAQGSVFSAEQGFAARNMERAGFGSMSTNIGRMSSLAGAGANNPQAGLQSVLEAAFTKSLDSSKAITMMVENTASMASSSIGNSRGGIDTTSSSARILSGLINPNMPNQEMAATRAATAAQILDTMNSGTGVNFADMSGTAAISKYAGVSRTQSIVLKGLHNSDAEALRAESARIEKLTGSDRMSAQGKFITNMRENYGLTNYADIDPKTGVATFNRLRAGLDQRAMGNFRSATSIADLNPNLAGYADLATGKLGLDELRSNKKYSGLYNKVSEAAGLQGLTLPEFLSRGGAGSISADAASKAAGAITGSGTVSDTRKTLDDLATVQFAEMTKEAKLAAEQLGGVAAALQAINEASKGLADKVSNKSSDTVMGASAEAAKSFEMGAETFTTSVEKFGTILNEFARNINVRVPEASQKRSAGN